MCHEITSFLRMFTFIDYTILNYSWWYRNISLFIITILGIIVLKIYYITIYNPKIYLFHDHRIILKKDETTIWTMSMNSTWCLASKTLEMAVHTYPTIKIKYKKICQIEFKKCLIPIYSEIHFFPILFNNIFFIKMILHTNKKLFLLL